MDWPTNASARVLIWTPLYLVECAGHDSTRTLPLIILCIGHGQNIQATRNRFGYAIIVSPPTLQKNSRNILISPWNICKANWMETEHDQPSRSLSGICRPTELARQCMGPALSSCLWAITSSVSASLFTMGKGGRSKVLGENLQTKEPITKRGASAPLLFSGRRPGSSRL